MATHKRNNSNKNKILMKYFPADAIIRDGFVLCGNLCSTEMERGIEALKDNGYEPYYEYFRINNAKPDELNYFDPLFSDVWDDMFDTGAEINGLMYHRPGYDDNYSNIKNLFAEDYMTQDDNIIINYIGDEIELTEYFRREFSKLDKQGFYNFIVDYGDHMEGVYIGTEFELLRADGTRDTFMVGIGIN